jgi:hypothetical protein
MPVVHIADYLNIGHWHPITTAPYNQVLELRALDHGKLIRIPFPCFRDNADRWINFDLGTPIVIAPVEWRVWDQAGSTHAAFPA